MGIKTNRETMNTLFYMKMEDGNMRGKWIGEEDNTSGSYFTMELCPELFVRKGGCMNAKKLYAFRSRFGEEYNITDKEVIDNINQLTIKGESVELHEYLYRLVIEKFGAIEFIKQAEHKIAEQRDIGYREGKKYMQKEIRKLIGLE